MLCLEILRRAQKSTWWRTVEAQILPCSSGAYRSTRKGRRHHWGARRKARGGARWKLKSCPAQVELTEAPAKAADIIGASPPLPPHSQKCICAPAQPRIEVYEARAKTARLSGSPRPPPRRPRWPDSHDRTAFAPCSRLAVPLPGARPATPPLWHLERWPEIVAVRSRIASITP